MRFVGGTKGGFIFTDFFFATDAMYSVAKILEMMAQTGQAARRSSTRSIPRLPRARRNVNCSWEHKGKVMRHIMHDTEGQRRDLVDGVKVYLDDGDERRLRPADPGQGAAAVPHQCGSTGQQTRGPTGNRIRTRKSSRWRDEP